MTGGKCYLKYRYTEELAVYMSRDDLRRENHSWAAKRGISDKL